MFRHARLLRAAYSYLYEQADVIHTGAEPPRLDQLCSRERGFFRRRPWPGDRVGSRLASLNSRLLRSRVWWNCPGLTKVDSCCWVKEAVPSLVDSECRMFEGNPTYLVEDELNCSVLLTLWIRREQHGVGFCMQRAMCATDDAQTGFLLKLLNKGCNACSSDTKQREPDAFPHTKMYVHKFVDPVQTRKSKSHAYQKARTRTALFFSILY